MSTCHHAYLPRVNTNFEKTLHTYRLDLHPYDIGEELCIGPKPLNGPYALKSLELRER